MKDYFKQFYQTRDKDEKESQGWKAKQKSFDLN